MKTAVILLCFSVFLISVEGRSQPKKLIVHHLLWGLSNTNIVLLLPNQQNAHQMMIVLRETSCAVTFLDVPTVYAKILLNTHSHSSVCCNYMTAFFAVWLFYKIKYTLKSLCICFIFKEKNSHFNI
ncbi:hypothetical protein Anas_12957 [Armadillidium nasatum]|uniref:Uncharacterized protein n=1 Tax=Armadillidium nasatum TaxID=96803 RepID=A0A5N5T792_9CRUS|nr:hypothetical protein Anas_12957 [Armadillidium nasatum]